MSKPYNSDDVANTLSLLVAVSSTLDKTEILNFHLTANPLFHRCICATYNPNVTYGIAKIPDSYIYGAEGEAFDKYTWKLLEKLASRKLSGKAARIAVRDELSGLSIRSGELLRRIILKDWKAGFNTTTINNAVPGTIDVFNCMKAEDYNPEVPLVYPVAAEEKIDGMRGVTIYDDGELITFTGTGKLITSVEHIQDKLLMMIHATGNKDNDLVFDGELKADNFYSTGEVRGKYNQATKVNYHIFDMLPLAHWNNPELSECYEYRRQNLERMFYQTNYHKIFHVQLVSSIVVYDKTSLTDLYNNMLDQGGEGLVVKDLNSFYQKKRSKDWIKLKATHTIDLEVTDIQPGTGKYSGCMGALICKLDDITVEVGSGFTDLQRQEFNHQDIVSKIIEVKYHEKTPDGSLRHPVFVKVRDDKLLD